MNNKIFILTTIALLSLISCNTDIKVSPGQAYFKSFTYEGNDPLLDKNRLSENEILNPLLQGSYSDASVCRKGYDYYMITANYAMYPGLPILHSKDLVNWEQIGYALNSPKQLLNRSLRAEQGLFAATIRYNDKDDNFYITGTLVGGGGHFVCKAKDPAGPWSIPEWLYGIGGVHPSLFFDESDNSRAYIVNQGIPNYDPPYTDYKVIWLQEFDLATMKLKGERKIILAGGDLLEKKPSWLETPHIYKTHDYYYLVASEGGGLGNGFAACIYRSKDIWGPYEHYEQNPILTQRRLSPGREAAVTCTGHVEMFETHNGDWWAVFQGVRPYTTTNDYNQGRETFIYPITWDGDWPYIIRNGESIPYKIKAPFGAQYIVDSVPFQKYIPHGNFKYVEHFVSDSLPMQWMELRTPTNNPTIMPNGEEGLMMLVDNHSLRSQNHPGFVGIRQMHNIFSTEVEMHFKPNSNNEFAGLALYLSDQNHYIFGVGMDNDFMTVRLQRAELQNDENKKVEIGKYRLGDDFAGKIFLRIERTTTGFVFLYKFDESDEYKTLIKDVAVEYLSVNRSGGFMGVIIGPYASNEEGD